MLNEIRQHCYYCRFIPLAKEKKIEKFYLF